jgi:hypothetical protein
MSLREEYRTKFGIDEGDRLYESVQGTVDSAMDVFFDVAWLRQVRRERACGEYEVGLLLDDLCRRWGMDPVEVWRRRRQEVIDRQERDRVAAMRRYFNITLPVYGDIKGIFKGVSS